MRTKEYTYVASESLVQEAKEKRSNIYLNFAYTDYIRFLLFRTILYRNGVWHDNSGGATIY